MKNSMRDQLLRAGVASKKQAQKVGSEKRKKQKQARKHRSSANADIADAFQTRQAEKATRDRELNQRKQVEIELRAIAAQIRQLIEMNRLPCDGGEMVFNFVDGKTVGRVLVTENTHKQLSIGRLSIAKLDDHYEVVPKVVADKISERDASYVIASNESSGVTDENDPYAAYQVPDDLMW